MPSLGPLTINALTAATKVIVPVQCEYSSMRGLVQLQNLPQTIQVRTSILKSRSRGASCRRCSTPERVHAQEAVEILEENFGDLVFKTRIRKTIKFAEAPVRGASVFRAQLFRVENLRIVEGWFRHFLIDGKRGLPPLPKVRGGR